MRASIPRRTTNRRGMLGVERRGAGPSDDVPEGSVTLAGPVPVVAGDGGNGIGLVVASLAVSSSAHDGVTGGEASDSASTEPASGVVTSMPPEVGIGPESGRMIGMMVLGTSPESAAWAGGCGWACSSSAGGAVGTGTDTGSCSDGGIRRRDDPGLGHRRDVEEPGVVAAEVEHRSHPLEGAPSEPEDLDPAAADGIVDATTVRERGIEPAGEVSIAARSLIFELHRRDRVDAAVRERACSAREEVILSRRSRNCMC